MAPQSGIFPIFLRAEYREDANGVPKFISRIQQAVRISEAEMARVGTALNKALSAPRVGSGALDLGTAQLREHIKAQEQAAAAAREIQAATLAVANATGTFNATLTPTINAYRDVAKAKEEAARASRAELVVLEQVQAELAKGTTALRARLEAEQNLANFRKTVNLNEGALRVAAGQASVDRAALSGATLQGVLGRVNRGTSPLVEEQRTQQAAQTEQLARAQDELGRAAARLTSQIDPLADAQQRYDATLAEASRLLDAGAISTEQYAAAQTFASTQLREAGQRIIGVAEAEARRAQQQRDAVASQQALAASAAQLRSEIDPMFAAQQRFDAELQRADQLLNAGVISTQEYAAAQEIARERLREAAAAATENAEAIERAAQAQAEATFALDTAIGRKRNDTGSLDLGLGDLSKQIQQQQAVATASREIAAAAQVAAAANGGLNAELNEVAAATAKVSAQEDARLAELRRQEAALTAVQQELNKTASATDEVVEAQRRGTSARGSVINSVRAERTAFVQLGQQLQDITVQAQAGTSGFTIFAQQVPQAAFALSGLADSSNETLAKVGEFAGFLSGPWGAALFAATAVLGPFIADLIGTQFAAEDARQKIDALVEAKKDDVAETDLARKAEQAFALSIEGVTDAVRRNREAIEALTSAKKSDSEETLRNSRIQLANALALQFNTQQQIFNAKALLEAQVARASGPGQGAELAALGIPARQAALDELLAGFVEGGQQITEINNQIRQSQALVSVERGVAGEEGAIKRRYETELEGLKKTAVARGLSTEQIEKEAAAIKAREQAALAALKPDRQQRPRVDRSAERLANFGERAAEQIQRINERFDEQPRLIDQAAQATRQLDSIIADLEKRKPIDFEKLVEDAQAAKLTIQDALVRPFEQLREESQRRLEIEGLLAQGQFDRAAALQDIFRLEQQLGPLTADQRADVEGIVVAEQQRLRVLRDQRAVFEAQLDVLDQVRSDLTAILSGRSTDFFGNFKQALLDLQGQRLFESIFGDAFRDIQNELQKSTPQGRANAAYVQQVERTAHATERVGNSAITLAEELDRASSIVRGAAEQTLTGTAANDNFSVDSITVTGDRGHTASGRRNGEVRIARPSVLDLAARISKGIGDSIAVELEDLLGARFAQTLGNIIGGFIGGKAVGGTPGGIIGALRGVLGAFADKDGKLSKTLASIDKALGGALAGTATGTQVAGLSKALGLGGSTTGAQIGGALGSFLPIPGGNIIGAVIGNFVGALFKKTPRASATIGGVGDSLGITSLTGTNASLRNTAGDLGNSVLESINRIAQQLGADFNPGAGTVSIGQRRGSIRVDPTGRGITRVGNGAIDFGEDTEAAIAFAVRDLIQDGVITGLRQSEQNLLRAGNDVEAALADVLRFRSVFDQLDEIKDPVGFAVRSLNREFESLIDLFEQAGATAEEFASLEELYNLRRAEAIREATDQVVGSLRSLLNDLKIGDSGLSLRSRQQNAVTEFDALAARVAAGDTSAFDDFADISQQLLEIERQLFGSTDAYFDRLQQVTALTEQAIADQTNVTSIGAGQGSPFDDQAGIARTIEATSAEQIGYLRAINDNLIALNPNSRPAPVGGGGGGSASEVAARLIANF